MQPKTVTHTGDIQKVVDFRYFIQDESQCNKVAFSSPPLTTNNVWVSGIPCADDPTGKYFVDIAAKQIRGVSQAVETIYDSNHFGVIAQNNLGVISRQTWYTTGRDKGNIHRLTDAAGNKTTFSHYTKGIPQTEVRPDNVVVSRQVDAIGAIKSVTIAGRTTHYRHTPVGALSGISFPKIDSQPITVDYFFAPNTARMVIKRGNLTQTNYYDLLGREVKRVYDGGDGKIITYQQDYDSKGRLAKQTFANSNDGIRYEYDMFDRLTKTCDTRGCVSHRYNVDREVTTDANGHQTTHHYNRYGSGLSAELVQINSPEGVNTTIVRNANGDITSVIQNGIQRDMSYFTDKGLGVRSINDPERGLLSYERDTAGRVTKESVGHYQKHYTYDSMNRIHKIVLGADEESSKTFYYDSWGNLRKAYREKSMSNSTWTYQYDTNNNMTAATLNISALTFNSYYTVDEMDNTISITYPSLRKVTYTRDSLGRINLIRLNDSVIAKEVDYHANGVLKQFTLGNGSSYATDLNRQQAIEQIRIDGGNVVQLDYRYDAVGNIERITDSVTPNNSKSLQYDGLDRLIKADANAWGIIDYVYDNIGNLKQKIISGGSDVDGLTWNYRYDDDNRLIGIDGSVYSQFSYDDGGNIIHDGRHSYFYDDNQQLLGVNDGERYYYYDANDNRVMVDKWLEVKEFQFYNRGQLLGEYDYAGKAIREYLYLGDMTIAQIEGVYECVPSGSNNCSSGNPASGGSSQAVATVGDEACDSGKAQILSPSSSASSYFYLLNHFYGEKQCIK